MKTEVFRKGTHTDKCLHFESRHSAQHKVSIPQTLFTRAARFTTPEDEEHETGNSILRALENSYPKRMVRRIHRRVKNKERLRMGNEDGSRPASRELEVGKRVYINKHPLHPGGE